MIHAFAGGFGRKVSMLAMGACLAFSSTPSQAMPIRVAPLDPGAQPIVEQVRATSRPRRVVRRGGRGGAGAALALGAVALGVGAIIASQQRNREERRARRYYEQQYYPVEQQYYPAQQQQFYYDPGYVEQPTYQQYPVYAEPVYQRYVQPQPVYRAPRRVYQPAPAPYYRPPRVNTVHVLRPPSRQTLRRERHEALRQHWNR